MRILYHHRILAADGMQVHVKELVGAFERLGHQVHMVGPQAAKSDGKQTLTGRLGDLRAHFPAVLGEVLEAGYNFKAYPPLKREAHAVSPDFIYERYNSFLLAGLWLKRRLGIPYLIEVNAPLCHERALLGNLQLQGLARAMERKVWRGADAVLPVSDALADYVRREGVAEGRIHVIPNGVRPELYRDIRNGKLRTKLGLDGKTVFGFVGYVREWHGLDRVLHAFAHLADPDLHLLIVGEGPASEALRQTAQDLGIAAQLTFTGARPHEEIPALLGAFDVALQPDVTDYASPLKLFEYLAAGCALIAPDRPNIRELVTDGETALLIDPKDDKALSDAIAVLARDTVKRRALGQAAHDLIEKRDFTWDGNARKVTNLADRLIRQAPKNGA
ncbi:glycosyl transferase family 1 [Iodidimonas gelatinilytica]|uniref:Glycosyl transferase family 1 n=1 Tax=Iodidimonas gelatinilytica TaxID=1236966 RepID=A0A5A7MXS5_9PROT|nr:glycosyltransferase family 4 protein [Iodidimonas gelatinilytica]GER00225.1 glycosyl transferase family 1 [Iodidimonas gelatinilytica]